MLLPTIRAKLFIYRRTKDAFGRGRIPPPNAIPPFCPRRQNGGAKNAAQGPFLPLGIPPFVGQRRGSHALRAYLHSVPTPTHPHKSASSAKQGRPRCSWSPKTAQIGRINGKKRVEGRFRSPWICCGEGAPHGRKMKLGL